MKMKTNTVMYKVLRFLFLAGPVREKDISLYIRNKYKQSENVSKAIKSLLSIGVIERKEYKLKKAYHKGDTENVLFITKKGKAIVIDLEENSYYKKQRYTYKYDLEEESDALDKKLTDVGILAMFSTNDIPVFCVEKPSLSYLQSVLTKSFPCHKDEYMDNLSYDECKKVLDKGIYYSESEVLDYANSLSIGLSDTISGTRIRGIFVSTYNLYAVYVSRKYDNKILRVNIKGEKGLINMLQVFSSFTKVYRPIPEFDEYEISENTGKLYVKNKFYNSPYALVFSDGNMLAYSIATGNSKGQVKKVDISLATEKRERMLSLRPVYDNSNKASTYLTAASNLYSKIFVVPTSINGLYSLNYLLTHSQEEYRNDGIEIMKNYFDKDPDSVDAFPYNLKLNNKKVSCTYIPVFEAKALYDIAKGDKNPVIVTYKDLLDSIAHSIRKEGVFFNASENKLFDKNEVIIYDKYGKIAGETMLDVFLKQNNLTFDKKLTRYSLPKSFEMSYIEFYNKIARGEIKIEDIVSYICTKDYVLPKRNQKRYEVISISISRELLEIIRGKAKNEGISVSKYISNSLNNLTKD